MPRSPRNETNQVPKWWQSVGDRQDPWGQTRFSASMRLIFLVGFLHAPSAASGMESSGAIRSAMPNTRSEGILPVG